MWGLLVTVSEKTQKRTDFRLITVSVSLSKQTATGVSEVKPQHSRVCLGTSFSVLYIEIFLVSGQYLSAQSQSQAQPQDHAHSWSGSQRLNLCVCVCL